MTDDPTTTADETEDGRTASEPAVANGETRDLVAENRDLKAENRELRERLEQFDCV